MCTCTPCINDCESYVLHMSVITGWRLCTARRGHTEVVMELMKEKAILDLQNERLTLTIRCGSTCTCTDSSDHETACHGVLFVSLFFPFFTNLFKMP